MNTVVLPGRTCLREKERTVGGNAEPNSELAMEIVRSVRDRLNNTYYNSRNHKHRAPRIDPAKSQRTKPMGDPYRPKESQS